MPSKSPKSPSSTSNKKKKPETDNKINSEKLKKLRESKKNSIDESKDEIGDNDGDSRSSEPEDTETKSLKNEILESAKNDEHDVPKRFPKRRRSYQDVRDAAEDIFIPERTTEVPESTQAKVNVKIPSKNHKKDSKKDSSIPKKSNKASSDNSTDFDSLIVNKNMIGIIILSFVTIGVYVLWSFFPADRETKNITIEMIKKNFPNQENQLWRAVGSGINDTITYEHPSSYILLHEERAEKTTRKLLSKLSQYTVCQLSKCENDPIQLSSELLKSPEFLASNDYGSIIARFKKDLDDIGVMTIENLDEIPEKYALAFHSFCDEVSPLVKKSAFFFTMKVDKFRQTPLFDLRNVERILRMKWKGIEDDVFAPLFTRLSGMLLRIHPEKH